MATPKECRSLTQWRRREGWLYIKRLPFLQAFCPSLEIKRIVSLSWRTAGSERISSMPNTWFQSCQWNCAQCCADLLAANFWAPQKTHLVFLKIRHGWMHQNSRSQNLFEKDRSQYAPYHQKIPPRDQAKVTRPTRTLPPASCVWMFVERFCSLLSKQSDIPEPQGQGFIKNEQQESRKITSGLKSHVLLCRSTCCRPHNQNRLSNAIPQRFSRLLPVQASF